MDEINGGESNTWQAGYREMAADAELEAEAEEWCEGLIGDALAEE